MNDDKLKELEVVFERDIYDIGAWERESVRDLITAYRQLEKDHKDRLETMKIMTKLNGHIVADMGTLKEANAELLAALKPFGDAFVERERLDKKGTVEAIWKLVETGNYETAHQVYTKHKVD